MIYSIQNRTEFIPAPNTYFQGETEKYSSSILSKGFTFHRSPRVMFNEVTDESHLVAYAHNPFSGTMQKRLASNAAQFSNTENSEKVEINEHLGPG